MRKGVRAAQNVNLLRWAEVYGISVEWNVLWGFPGEREADYVEQAGGCAVVIAGVSTGCPPAKTVYNWARTPGERDKSSARLRLGS